MNNCEEFNFNFPNLPFGLTDIVIQEQSDKLIAEAKSVIDCVLSLHDNEICYETVVENLAFNEAVFDSKRRMIRFLLHVAPNKSLQEANMNITQFCTDTEIQKNIFELLNRISLKNESLTHERERYLNKYILYKKRLGFHLQKGECDELESIRGEIATLCRTYTGNETEMSEQILFDLDELDGLSPDFIIDLHFEDTKYVVNLEREYVHQILKFCKVNSTREKIEKAYNARFIESNSSILEQIIKLRHQSAKILGYQSHVDFTTEILMSKNAKNVCDFLCSLALKITLSYEKEKDRLLYFKRKECEEMDISFDGKIHFYDLHYYKRIVEEKDFKIDHNVIKQYFPLKYVNEKLLELFQSLLHLQFHEVKGVKLWHPEVTLYSVREKNSGKLIGYFYLDLLARENKCKHITCFPIQSACATRMGYQLACAAMVASFKKSKNNTHLLLTHSEVVTYFGVFGQVMHEICSKTRYHNFSGMSVEADFLYAPSKMFENFAWEEETLRKISSHYITGERLSDDLTAKLCLSRNANISLNLMSQIALSMFDYKIHTSSEINAFEVYEQCCKEYMLIEPTPGTNNTCSFWHLCTGYDAKYYGYLWSQVFACDMFFSRFKKEGIFNPETGLSFRRNILEPGSTLDADELLKNFLGRDPIIKPFFKVYGITF